MRILVACEESQAVTVELRKLGHEAYSCDIEPCSGGHPEWRIMQDVLPLLNGKYIFHTLDGAEHNVNDRWDMIIAHPPCTYLSNAGARFLYPKGQLNEERLRKGIEASHFFMAFWYADCEKICIENPVPSSVYQLPKHTQTIQPYQFGHPVQKKTNLWLKNLPELKPTEIVETRQSTKIPGNWFNRGERPPKEQSKNIPGSGKSHGGAVGRESRGGIGRDNHYPHTLHHRERRHRRILWNRQELQL
jgi:hypothetical protein